MFENMTIDEVKEHYNGILSEYASEFNVEPFDGEIIVTQDMVQAYSDIRGDLIESGRVNKEEIEIYNGLTVQPFNNEGKFTILINENFLRHFLKDCNMTWVGTIVHEATHVNDFKDYFKLVFPTSYDELYDYSLHRMFLYWTEFHAKANGYYYVRKYTFFDVYGKEQVYDIVNTELPHHITDMITKVSGTNDVDKQMYAVMHFLGRLKVWRELFAFAFTDIFIHGLFKDNLWLEELFVFLCKYDTLQKIYPVFDKMENILNKHFI